MSSAVDPAGTSAQSEPTGAHAPGNGSAPGSPGNRPGASGSHNASAPGRAGGRVAPASVEEVLDTARTGLERVGPEEARRAVLEDDALLVDIRYQKQRERDGVIPGSVQIERNELEWRLDPRGSHRIPEATGHDRRIVVLCNEGYASSLAAASLQQLGLHRATDLEGGFQAWREAGLPVSH
ncbi:rhodanese-like domain-containing protein [Streptomyces fuscigenes]|uniref:rhodanese-like domain-containing protein n=1 Tax=Streptomyces fuscigenes TaxID=1528880 RepID=UPI001F25C7AC|nr:rhodanese-like domain-containing protein [Streptomyces fuscigenes]MCF3961169.1 sulfurtransferase [Streptomyces fuscigenes]